MLHPGKQQWVALSRGASRPVSLHRRTTSRRPALCRLDDASADPTFVCERVCTSPRLLRRMGSLAKVGLLLPLPLLWLRVGGEGKR